MSREVLYIEGHYLQSGSCDGKRCDKCPARFKCFTVSRAGILQLTGEEWDYLVKSNKLSQQGRGIVD